MVKFATKNGYRLLDMRRKLDTGKSKKFVLPDNIYPNKLEDCFDYQKKKEHVKI